MRKPKIKQARYLGIDPGKSGAIAMIGHNHKLEFIDWPKNDNLHLVSSQVERWTRKHDIRLVLLEKVSSMPKQGVKSMFTFGQNFGAWKMLLACLNIPHYLLTPLQWQKGMFTPSDGKDPKERAVTVCCRMFDSTLFYGPRGGKKDGRADAALMAYRAMQKYRGQG